jgi:hypothetical protein
MPVTGWDQVTKRNCLRSRGLAYVATFLSKFSCDIGQLYHTGISRFLEKLTRSRVVIGKCLSLFMVCYTNMIRLGVRHTCFTERAFASHRYHLLGTRNMSSIATHPSLRKVSTESRFLSKLRGSGATEIKIMLQMHPRRLGPIVRPS